jgi:hypothetical protein
MPHFVLYVDSDWASDLEGRRSTDLWTDLLPRRRTRLLATKKQALVTLSGTESEYVAMGEAGKEAIYIQASRTWASSSSRTRLCS